MADSPREAIILDLTRPPGAIVDPSPCSSWRGSLSRLPPFPGASGNDPIPAGAGPRPASACGGGIRGHRWQPVAVRLRRDLPEFGAGWEAQGAAGGSAREPDRAQPWANFGGWGLPRFLVVGGTVHGQVDRVRLVDA